MFYVPVVIIIIVVVIVVLLLLLLLLYLLSVAEKCGLWLLFLHRHSATSLLVTCACKHCSFSPNVFNSALLLASLPAYGGP